MDQPTILLVDDDEFVSKALVRTLKGEGYRLLAAANTEEALGYLRAQAIDVVISDHVMPGMTGLEFLKLVHDRRPEAVRIMLTGLPDVTTAIAAINQGEIYRFLTKPWDSVELKVTLRLAVEHGQLIRENRRLLAQVRCHEQQLAAHREAADHRSQRRQSSGPAPIVFTEEELRYLES